MSCIFCDRMEQMRQDIVRKPNSYNQLNVTLRADRIFNHQNYGSDKEHHFYELNYCPVCGREIEKHELRIN